LGVDHAQNGHMAAIFDFHYSTLHTTYFIDICQIIGHSGDDLSSLSPDWCKNLV